MPVPASVHEEAAMTKATRRLLAGVAITAMFVGGAFVHAADPEAAGIGRVRSNSPALVALINEAIERSGTFRGLVDGINASDGIVYVDEGKCRHGVRACLVAVTPAGRGRVLWAKVDSRMGSVDLMSAIGHELRHALEVLSEPNVRSSVEMFFLYSRIGSRGMGTGAFETMAAIQAGNAVRSEIAKTRRDRAAN
jgi:hypothetical protein